MAKGKGGKAKSQKLQKVSEEIWNAFRLSDHHYCRILPRSLNHKADQESRHKKDFTERKLCPQIFLKTYQKVGQSEIDLFAFRLPISWGITHKNQIQAV